jgi:hypothetical protein
MEQEYLATTLQLEWAVEDKRAADAALADARLDLRLAQAGIEAVVADLNALYHERQEVRAALRGEDQTVTETDVEESDSFLRSYADWLTDELERQNRQRYYRAIDVEYDASKRLADVRISARARGRELRNLLVAFAEGLVADAGTVWYSDSSDYDYDYGCDCPACRGYIDYFDYFDDEDRFVEEELLAVEALRQKLRTKRLKEYNPRRLKRKS